MQIEKESPMVGIMNGGGYPRGWKLMDEEGPSGQGQALAFDMERARLLHQHQLRENQCISALVKHINAPLDVRFLCYCLIGLHWRHTKKIGHLVKASTMHCGGTHWICT